MRVRLLPILFLLAPFVSAGEIDGHRQQSEAKIRKELGQWLQARRQRWGTCRACGGMGYRVTLRVTDAREVKTICKSCELRQFTIREVKFHLLYWDRYSARYRTEKQGRRYEKMIETLRKEPKLVNLDGLGIDTWDDIRIVVYGNFATVRMKVKRAGSWSDETRILIEDPAGTWCLRHPEADADFPLVIYPEAAEKEDEE